MGLKSASRSADPIPAGRAAAPKDPCDAVAWLDCRGRTPASIYEELHEILKQSADRKGVLLTVPFHLEHVEGSLSDLVLGLESILQTAPVPVVLGDPSGYAMLVLRTLRRDADVRIYRPSGEAARPRRVLIVDGSAASAKTVGDVLDAFGHAVTLANSGVEARRAIRALYFDFVILDLDLARLHSFGIARTLKERQCVRVVGVTSRGELWTLENLKRYGFPRVLSKPLSVMELLEEFAWTPVSRASVKLLKRGDSSAQ